MSEEVLTNILIPVLTPMIIGLVKLSIRRVPREFLPVLAAILGILLDCLARLSGYEGVGIGYGAMLGLAGVGVREALDQAHKRLRRSRRKDAAAKDDHAQDQE